MADTYLRQGPLDVHHPNVAGDAGTAVTLTVAEPRGQLVLRGDAGSAVFTAAVQAVTGAALPVTPLTSAVAGEFTLLWMGPDEWLLVMPDGRQHEVAAALHEKLGDEHHALADVSSSRIALVLSGERAREVLMKGCSLDLHPREFTVGRVDQSSLARCHVMLHLRDDSPCFDIYVHRSFADYCWRWLRDASAEFATPAAV